ncbi:SidA/IucD/PvdA family monooxygenase [Kitasatospora aureofaciens]|uniref:SidA/IucD/PvdA family monooxygenase n=1 Tax=Kitasatospora aureofaciens TaxID=1894 RepID=UPI0037C54107
MVGGGQSGAEIVNHLLADDQDLPASLTWLSSRAGFLPMDDSPFTNEWFTPSYVEYFHGLPADRRAGLLTQHRLASDGISESLLRDIYQRLYHLDMVVGAPVRHQLLAGRRVVGLSRDGGRLTAELHDEDSGRVESRTADLVVFCTGYRSSLPEFLELLRPRLVDEHGALRIRRDYSLDWDGPQELRIYVQNAAETTHGIADPNLSLAAWRSARIVNSLVGREVYRLDHFSTTVAWDRSSDHDEDPAYVTP